MRAAVSSRSTVNWLELVDLAHFQISYSKTQDEGAATVWACSSPGGGLMARRARVQSQMTEMPFKLLLGQVLWHMYSHCIGQMSHLAIVYGVVSVLCLQGTM